jgi:hypothetical protein
MGCGFEPMYQRAPAYRPQPFALSVTGSHNKDAYYTYKLKKELTVQLDFIPLKVAERVVAKVDLDLTFGDIGFGADTSVLRSQGQGMAKIALSRPGTLTPFYMNTLDLVSSYTPNMEEEFTNISARSAVRDRLVQNLARDIGRDIAFALDKMEPPENKGATQAP